MTDEATRKRNEEAALSGRFDRVAGVMQDTLSRGWPQYAGLMFVQEVRRPNPHPPDTPAHAQFEQQQQAGHQAAYAGFARNVYNSFYHAEGNDRQANLKMVVQQAHDFGRELFAQQNDSLGFANDQWISFRQGRAPGELMQFHVAVAALGADGCEHCKTSLDARAATRTCRLTTPDMVYQDRMKYFGTAMHELAHVVRSLSGTMKYDTLDEQRREETIARTFEHLMVAQTFGAAGLLQMKLSAAELIDGPEDRRYKYEAQGPMAAGIDFIQSHRKDFDAMTPRQLLGMAEQLVDRHDKTRDLTPEQRDLYRLYVRHISTDFNDLSQRMDKWQARELKDPGYAHAGERRPLALALRGLDEAVLDRVVSMEVLQNSQMRLNPLRPVELRRIGMYGEDMSDPGLAAALRSFSAAYNPSFCPPLAATTLPIPGPEGESPGFLVPYQPPAPGAGASPPAAKTPPKPE